MVDSEAMTSLSGSNPSRIAAGVWMVSTFLAGLAGHPRRAGHRARLRASSRCSSRPRSRRSSRPGCAACPSRSIVALLMGVAGSLVQYYLPPDSEVTANIIPSIPFAFVVISLDRQHHPQRTRQRGGRAWAARSTGRSPRTAAAGSPRRPTAENLYPKLNFWFPVVVFARHLPAALDLQAVLARRLMATGVCLAIVFISYTLVTGEGGMLWLCQITFAGVGALATGQLADRARLARARSRWSAGAWSPRAIGVVIGLLTIRLGQPLHRVGHVDLRAPHGAAGLHPGRRSRSSARASRVARPGLRDLRPRVHLLRARRSSRSSRSSSSTSDVPPPASRSTRCAGARTRRARWA